MFPSLKNYIISYMLQNVEFYNVHFTSTLPMINIYRSSQVENKVSTIGGCIFTDVDSETAILNNQPEAPNSEFLSTLPVLFYYFEIRRFFDVLYSLQSTCLTFRFSERGYVKGRSKALCLLARAGSCP